MPLYHEFLQQGQNLLPHIILIVTTFKIGWQGSKQYIIDVKAWHNLIILNNWSEAIHEPPVLIPPREEMTRKIAILISLD